jgi:formamidopyrimidine-DNA glycosylase
LPELPEVETIVRDLDRLIVGATIRDVGIVHADLIDGDPAEFARALRGRRIEGVSRRAKNIVIDLGTDRLVVNLGMTGRLLVVDPADPAPSHPGVRFELEDGRLLLYHDVRRVGRLALLTGDAWAERDRDLGYEPLSDEFTADALLKLARRSRVAVKTWLMDQRRIVGVGNIYASEALFRAGIDPRRPANSLKPREARRLQAAIQAVLREAIEFRGTTLLDYRDASGEQGRFADRLRVYDREGGPCRVCGTPIVRIVQGGRSTFYCPKCQK